MRMPGAGGRGGAPGASSWRCHGDRLREQGWKHLRTTGQLLVFGASTQPHTCAGRGAPTGSPHAGPRARAGRGCAALAPAGSPSGSNAVPSLALHSATSQAVPRPGQVHRFPASGALPLPPRAREGRAFEWGPGYFAGEPHVRAPRFPRSFLTLSENVHVCVCARTPQTGGWVAYIGSSFSVLPRIPARKVESLMSRK